MRWNPQTAPPLQTTPGGFAGVSCPRRNDCVAVGYLSNPVTGTTLADRWDGSQWSTTDTVDELTPAGADLAAVSCTTSSACTAVGSTSDGPFAVRWDGTAWTIQSLPMTANSRLFGVSCPTLTMCMAVGPRLTAIWTSGQWTLQSTPPDAYLTGVSCTSPTSCTAVGASNVGPNEQPLVERFDGSTWSVEDLGPMGVGSGIFNSVSCVSVDFCMAVGTVVARWDGSVWTVQTPSAPAGFAISCASPAACTAVGYVLGSNTEAPAAAGWDGNTWTSENVPDPNTGLNALWGVSCVSAVACTAVGQVASVPNALEPAVEVWDGSSWTAQSAPRPSVPTPNGPPVENILTSISCPSAGYCVAVGNNPFSEIYS
jgi:hypothetical protein